MDVPVSGGRARGVPRPRGGEGENGKQKMQGGHGGTGSQTRPRRHPEGACFLQLGPPYNSRTATYVAVKILHCMRFAYVWKAGESNWFTTL